jgi:hypothetical protein
VTDVERSEVHDLEELGRFARQLYRERRLRDDLLGADLFGEAAWDIILDLFASHTEGKAVRISSACIAASVPATTGLRYINEMEKRGLLTREAVPNDGRGQNIRLARAVVADLVTLLRRMREDRRSFSQAHRSP